MITVLIVAAIWMNECLDNLCHMNRTTGTTYAFSKRWNIYRNFERLQNSLEFSKLHWKYRCKHIRIHCPPNLGSQYFNYKQFHSILLQVVVDANLKFVSVEIVAYGKQKRWWSFPKLGSLSELGNTKFASAWGYSFATQWNYITSHFCWWLSVSSNDLLNVPVQRKNI